MAEENKIPEVELDTDGVNEEKVNVPAKEPDESFAQKDTVDLGYTDVTGGKTAKELLQETKEKPEEKPEPIRKSEEPLEQKVEEEDRGDLEEYSDKVQNRIKKLTGNSSVVVDEYGCLEIPEEPLSKLLSKDEEALKMFHAH